MARAGDGPRGEPATTQVVKSVEDKSDVCLVNYYWFMLEKYPTLWVKYIGLGLVHSSILSRVLVIFFLYLSVLEIVIVIFLFGLKKSNFILRDIIQYTALVCKDYF